jgi:oxalate decarboxylase/phosphoglucose isomerase-like protein (cupin superfamily)
MLLLPGRRFQSADIHAGDIGVVKRMRGHSIENTGTTDAVVVTLFKTNRSWRNSLMATQAPLPA